MKRSCHGFRPFVTIHEFNSCSGGCVSRKTVTGRRVACGYLGSARVPRAGESVLAIANFVIQTNVLALIAAEHFGEGEKTKP